MGHINMVKGDFVFKQWENESFKAMYIKFEELEKIGYEMVDEEHSYQDVYFHFKKKGHEEILVTLMCY